MSDENKDAATNGTGDGKGKGTDDVEARINATVDAKLASGDVRATVREFVEQNYKLREEVRTLKAKAPADGALILTGDDAKAWGAYREMGAVADVRKAFGERDQLKVTADKYERERLNARAARALGCEPCEDFDLLVKDLPIEVVSEKDKDGNAVESARVRGATESDKPTPLADYLKANRPRLFAACKAEPERRPGTPPPNPHLTPPPRPSKGQEEDAFRDLPYQYAPPAM